MRITNTNDDKRGEQLADKISAADYTIPKENGAARLSTNGRSTSPYISKASNDVALLLDWSVTTSLASDNLPILITINSELSTIDGPRRTYINFKKANWARYAETCYKYLTEAGKTRTVKKLHNAPNKGVRFADKTYQDDCQ